jgi:tetratricopeptide (TPR) repeat protein
MPTDEKESVVELKVADGDVEKLVEVPEEDFSPEPEPTPTTLRSGDLPHFGEDYETIALITCDCFGELYKVRNKRMNTEMCARLIPSEKFHSDESRKAFLRFCRRYLTVNHPAMAALYSFHEDETGVWFLMDPIDSPSLANWIDNGEFRSSAKIADIFEQLADCIEALHQVGIRFGAMTPSGIFVQETAHGHKILLRDWWAYALLQAQEGKPDAASMPYASPEQLQGDGKLDERADIYTFGAMLFEALSGHTPFEHSDSLKLAIKILSDERPPVDGPFAGTPFAKVAENCLNKDSKQRYDGIKSLQEDLRAAARGAPLPFRMAPNKKSTQISDARAVLLAAVFSLFLLAGFSAYYASYSNPLNDPLFDNSSTVAPPVDTPTDSADFEERGDYPGAIAVWQSEVDMHPGDAWPLINLGRLQGMNHEHEAAFNSLRHAAALDNVSGEPFYQLGHLQMTLGQNADAIDSLNKAVQREPENATYYNELAYTYSEAGQFDKAIEAAKTAVRFDPDTMENQFNLGVAYYGGHKFADALSAFKTALSQDSENAGIFTNLSLTYLKLGMKGQALSAAQQAAALDPHDVLYQRNLAHIYSQLGDLKKAEEIYRHALNLDRFDSGAWAGLVDTLQKMGRTAEAKEAAPNILE